MVAVACGRAGPTDAGWIGTWVRGDAERTRSAISIWLEDGRHRFAVHRTNADGSARLECDRDGRCLEYAGDAPYYEYRYEVVEADDSALVVETQGRPLEGGRGHPITLRERFEREADGLALRRYRVALNDRPLPPSDQFVRFVKHSDAPFDE
jgi:hypothetical protein